MTNLKNCILCNDTIIDGKCPSHCIDITPNMSPEEIQEAKEEFTAFLDVHKMDGTSRIDWCFGDELIKFRQLENLQTSSEYKSDLEVASMVMNELEYLQKNPTTFNQGHDKKPFPYFGDNPGMAALILFLSYRYHGFRRQDLAHVYKHEYVDKLTEMDNPASFDI